MVFTSIGFKQKLTGRFQDIGYWLFDDCPFNELADTKLMCRTSLNKSITSQFPGFGIYRVPRKFTKYSAGNITMLKD